MKNKLKEGLLYKLREQEVKDLSDEELTRALKDCILGKRLIEYAKELRDNGELTKPFEREITARELADLSETWENPTVDTTKYRQCVLSAVEVDIETFETYRSNGGLCQVLEERYYIA